MTTKMDVLRDRLTDAEATAKALREEIDGLAATPCNLTCGGCGTVLDTEADFADHFVISKANLVWGFLNLGECPHTSRGQAILARA